MLKIVTDSTADMPEDWISQYDLHIIPINIQFENQTFLQGIDLSNADFYRYVEIKRVIPKTSQPSPQQFKQFYEGLAQPGDTILSMHVTSKLSGTYASAVMAANDLKDKYFIIPFDSAAGSAALGLMCKEARLMERASMSVNDILDRMKYIRKNINLVLTLNTLEYARMSGRVKALQAALASLLNVKPIVVLRDGVLNMTERVRTRHRAIARVVDLILEQVGDRLVNVAVVQAQDISAGGVLLEKVRNSLNCREIIMTELSVSVAANLGPGTVGIIAYPDKED
jgi:DegV family protein with EDD domain